jgi:hypothetical protein
VPSAASPRGIFSRARFITIYFAFWAVYFEAARAVFLMYQWRDTARLSAAEIAGSFLLGLKLDLSAAAFITMLPLCLVARAGFIPNRIIRRILGVYSTVCIAVVALAMTTDLQMFRAWGHRIDAPSLYYLSSPREAFASAAGSPLPLLAMILVGATLLMSGIFATGVMPHARELPRVNQAASVMLMFASMPGLIVAERGGLDWRVHVTTSSVYFSRTMFANQAAVNPAWNLAASLFYLNQESVVDSIDDPARARPIVDSLLSKNDDGAVNSQRVSLLRVKPERIVLVLWEGLTAKVIEPLGGISDVTPGFSRLSHEGVLFTRLYASGQRTTNGFVAVLSGLPGHPTANPLHSQERSAALPRLSATLSAAGYRTAFYYGAPLEFDNRERYMLRSHFDTLIQKGDFDARERTSVWGAQDPVMLDRLFHAIDNSNGPFFAATLTLSSHEPFDVPLPVLVSGHSIDSRFMNAQAYSDKAVENFIRRLESRPGWDKTLVIILADHGSPYPTRGLPSAAAPGQFRIPMLWLGGALSVHDTTIDHIGSQYDLPTTLLSQLNLPARDFHFGKDLLATGSKQFAFYSFQDGFGYIDNDAEYVFDNSTKSIVYHKGNLQSAAIDAGRAFQQNVMEEYVRLGRPLSR